MFTGVVLLDKVDGSIVRRNAEESCHLVVADFAHPKEHLLDSTSDVEDWSHAERSGGHVVCVPATEAILRRQRLCFHVRFVGL